MQHHNFTADEAMGWLRVARPGSVIGPQQQYLRDNEARMHALGKQGLPGMGLRIDERAAAGGSHLQEDASSEAARLAEMVTKGMHSREQLRQGGGGAVTGQLKLSRLDRPSTTQAGRFRYLLGSTFQVTGLRFAQSARQ